MINNLSSENQVKNSISSSTEKSLVDNSINVKEFQSPIEITEEVKFISQNKSNFVNDFFFPKKPSITKITKQFIESDDDNSSGQSNNEKKSKQGSKSSSKEMNQIPIRTNNHTQTLKNPSIENPFKKLSNNKINIAGREQINNVRNAFKSSNKSLKIASRLQQSLSGYLQEKSSGLKLPFQELFMSQIRKGYSRKRLSNYGNPTRRYGISTAKLRRESVLRTRIRMNQSFGVNNKRKECMLDPMSLFGIISKSEENTKYGQTKILIKVVDIFLAFLVICNIILSLLDNEIYYSQTDASIKQYLDKTGKILKKDDIHVLIQERTLSTTENILRLVNMIIVACSLFLIIVHYKLSARLLRIGGLLSEFEGIYSAGFLKRMILEIFILVWAYPPYLNNVIYGTMLGQPYVYTVNSLISIAVTFKSYIILRIYSYFSIWTSDIATSICNKENVSANVHFAIKAELKKRPYWVLTILFGSVTILLSVSLRTFEYYVSDNHNSFGYSKSDLKMNQNYFQSLATCAWVILVTMTTVGYGDFVPNSHYGRFLGVLSCVIGLLLVSLIIVSLALITEFSEEEKKAYSIIKKLTAHQNVHRKAYEVIVVIIKLRKMIMDKSKYKLSEGFILVTQLKKSISAFKNDCKVASSLSLPLDQTYKLIQERFTGDFQTLIKTIKKVENIDEIFDALSLSQQDCADKMEVITSRTERLAEFLVKLNNDNFKDSMLKYQNTRGKSNFFKSDYIESAVPSLCLFKDLSPVNKDILNKPRNLNFTINEIRSEEEKDFSSLAENSTYKH